MLRIENFSEYFSSWIYYLNSHRNPLCSRPFEDYAMIRICSLRADAYYFPGVGDGGTQGKFGQKRCAAEIFKPWLFLRQKSLTSLDLNQLIGCLQTSTRCFKRQKISSPHGESCLFTITDFVAEARKQNHILQDFWTAAYWTRLSKISWFVSCKAKNSSARHWQITIFCDNRVQ